MGFDGGRGGGKWIRMYTWQRRGDYIFSLFRTFCLFFFLYFIPLIVYRERRRICVESCCGRCSGFLFESVDVDELIEGCELNILLFDKLSYFYNNYIYVLLVK